LDIALVQVAAFADEYGVQDAMEAQSELWIKHVKPRVPLPSHSHNSTYVALAQD
jgi:hypothetical protein